MERQLGLKKVVNWSLLAAIMIYAFLLTTPWNMKAFWIDEIYSVVNSSQTVSSIISCLKYDSGEPFYYILLHFWMRLAGTGELAVRMFSILIFLVSIIAVYYLAILTYKKSLTAILSAFFYAVGQINIFHATNARMYGLLGLVTIISMILLIEIFIYKRDNIILYILYILVNAAGMFTHYWYVFVMAAHYIYLIMFFRKELVKVHILIVLSALPFTVLWLPSFLGQLGNGSVDWMKFKGGEISGTFNYFLYGRKDKVIGMLATMFIGSFVILGIKQGWRKTGSIYLEKIKSQIKNDAGIMMFVSLVIMLLLPYLVSKYAKPIYELNRGPIISYIPFVILCSSLINGALQRVFITFFVAVVLLFSSIYYFSPRQIECPGYPEIAKVLWREYNGDVVIFTGLSKYPVRHYFESGPHLPEIFTISYPAIHDEIRNWAKFDTKITPAIVEETDGLISSMRSGIKKIWVCTYNISDDKCLFEYLNSRICVDYKLSKHIVFGKGILNYYIKK